MDFSKLRPGSSARETRERSRNVRTEKVHGSFRVLSRISRAIFLFTMPTPRDNKKGGSRAALSPIYLLEGVIPVP